MTTQQRHCQQLHVGPSSEGSINTNEVGLKMAKICSPWTPFPMTPFRSLKASAGLLPKGSMGGVGRVGEPRYGGFPKVPYFLCTCLEVDIWAGRMVLRIYQHQCVSLILKSPLSHHVSSFLQPCFRKKGTARVSGLGRQGGGSVCELLCKLEGLTSDPDIKSQVWCVCKPSIGKKKDRGGS